MATSSSSSSSTTSTSHTIVVDPFCLRQFSPDYQGAHIDMDPKVFESRVNEYFNTGSYPLKDGYAPFCKHVFLPNFLEGMTSGTLKITPENEGLLRTTYEARTDKELPIMMRYFPKSSVTAPPARYLDLILYSRDQIIKENQAMGNDHLNGLTNAPWGIVSIKPQDVDHELPMQPITMMRNALGKEYGGSGVPLDHNKYLESVRYWSDHAIIR